MDFIINSFTNSTLLSAIKDHDGWVDYFERVFLKEIIQASSYEWAVRIEDSIIITVAILFTLCLSFFVFTPLILKGPFDYSVRFSDRLQNVLYMFVDHNGFKELILRKPKGFWERIELGIALVYVGLNGEKRPIKTKNVRVMLVLCLILFTFLLICMIIFVVFTFNVVHFKGVAS